jgi:hypothetical protein
MSLRLLDDGTTHLCRFQAECAHCDRHWPKAGYVPERIAVNAHSIHRCAA